MKTQMLSHVRQLFNVDHVPRHINRHNQRQWVRSVRFLGDKWLLAKPIEKKSESKKELSF